MKALLVQDGERTPIQVTGLDDIRGYFAGTAKGVTLRELDTGVYLRKWTDALLAPTGLEIYDAYLGDTLKLVDLPEEWIGSSGAGSD